MFTWKNHTFRGLRSKATSRRSKKPQIFQPLYRNSTRTRCRGSQSSQIHPKKAPRDTKKLPRVPPKPPKVPPGAPKSVPKHHPGDQQVPQMLPNRPKSENRGGTYNPSRFLDTPGHPARTGGDHWDPQPPPPILVSNPS